MFSFEAGVHEIKDLKIGMTLPGIVTNVTNFGAFVDVGVHQDGLVHISHLADRFVKDPNQVVAVQQKVKVTVMEVDAVRKRIALSMKSDPFDGAVSNSTEERKQAPAKVIPKIKVEHLKKEQPAETMEEKMAALMNKFKK